MKLPYETIHLYAFYLIDAAALADISDETFMLWDSYHSYLDNSGWTDQEFDMETLKRIDAAWMPEYN